MVRSALVGSQKRASKQCTNGWPCCERRWRKTMTGWTRFSPAWKKRKEEKNDEQDDVAHRGRFPRSRNQALRRASRGRLPRPHRSEAGSEMDARPGRLDDARMHQ